MKLHESVMQNAVDAVCLLLRLVKRKLCVAHALREAEGVL
jgi:hypothetical protein